MLEAEITNLKRQLEEADLTMRSRVTQLKNEIDTLKSTDDCRFEFDWEESAAFSIERSVNGSTVIGYYKAFDENGKRTVGEWTFFCSKDEHNRLANEFKEYINGKKE